MQEVIRKVICGSVWPNAVWPVNHTCYPPPLLDNLLPSKVSTATTLATTLSRWVLLVFASATVECLGWRRAEWREIRYRQSIC